MISVVSIIHDILDNHLLRLLLTLVYGQKSHACYLKESLTGMTQIPWISRCDPPDRSIVKYRFLHNVASDLCLFVSGDSSLTLEVPQDETRRNLVLSRKKSRHVYSRLDLEPENLVSSRNS